MSQYCVYLTAYSGSDLPPFYIGSASVENTKRGYRGSVGSKQYREKWFCKLKTAPLLFKTIILTEHDTREQALEQEEKVQRELDVIRSSLFLNMSYARGGFIRGPKTDLEKQQQSLRMKGKPCFPGSVRNTGKKCSPETIEKMRVAALSRAKPTAEHKIKSGAAHRGKKLSAETRAKMSIAQKLRYESKK